MVKKMFFISAVVLCLSCTLFGQGRDEKRYLGYGIKAGITYNSVITGLETTILSEPYFLNYTLKTQPRMGYVGGAFINFRFLDALLGIQSEIIYAQQGSDLLFNNTEKDFNYRMQFNYQYVNASGMFKFYPWKGHEKFDGLNVGAGPQLGFNIASNNIIYTSGGSGRLAAFGSDLEQQQQLRNVLKGKTNFGFNVGLGYEFRPFGLTVDARYYMGITDVVETLANNYNFIENKNKNQAFMFTLGWDFSYFNNTY